MNDKLPFSKILIIGLMLFAMFLGAGNVIFAPIVGQQAGTNIWVAMGGFLITGVGLVLLAIMALTRGGGTVEKLASRVHPKFAVVFSILLFLALGPFYVIPRTTSVVYEIAIKPVVGSDNTSLYLFIFSVIFIGLTILLSWNTTKFVDRLGKMIAPVFSILLLVLVVTSIVNPMGEIGEPQEEYMNGVFLKGFTQGYLTMDVLAAFVFGGIFIKSIKGYGIKSEKEISKIFIKAGLITTAGLVALQVSMAWIGATSVDAIGFKENGGEILAQSSEFLLGPVGIYMIGLVILLTGITTNVACLGAVSEYFERIQSSLSYKKWIIVFAILSLIFTNFGLNTILTMASPVLLLLYPLAIALIALIFANNMFNGHQSVYVGTIIGVGIVAILDALKDAGIAPDAINDTFSFIPLFANGAGWIITGIIGFIVGLVIAKVKKETSNLINNAGQKVTE
ncbi:MAG TPA: branched-chain amino acid transport system II carrier protein [Sporosarcina psychrophila]|uniref:Branched-chain amino acid transport system carrier protein n=2 Tax=Bacillales TaxID=1385 RepID=A0A921B5U1_9STAP|nr:branched-chain amino acid transport system II carrier protein [Aliicoccus persicus]HJF31006.1 branched-chain amino acid transport system II carrier protein [Sporosarcina psychrophila]